MWKWTVRMVYDTEKFRETDYWFEDLHYTRQKSSVKQSVQLFKPVMEAFIILETFLEGKWIDTLI